MQIRTIAILPLLCAVVAFVLSMLCLFAGSHPGFLEDAAILTLNASELGHNTVLSAATPTSTGVLSSLESAVANAANNVGNTVITDVEKDLGIHDFYSAHMLDYCEGSYDPNGSVPGASETVTYCSPQSANFWFDPTSIIGGELRSGITLNDLHFPQSIQDDLNALKTAFNASFVIYCIGIAFTGVLLITSFIGIFTLGIVSVLGNILIALLAFIFLGIASAILTVIAVRGSDAINNAGAQIGLAAYRGDKFLAMTWSATGLLLLAAVVWCFGCCFGRRHRRGEPGYVGKRG